MLPERDSHKLDVGLDIVFAQLDSRRLTRWQKQHADAECFARLEAGPLVACLLAVYFISVN